MDKNRGAGNTRPDNPEKTLMERSRGLEDFGAMLVWTDGTKQAILRTSTLWAGRCKQFCEPN